MPLPHHFLCEAREEGLDSNFLLFFPWFLTIPFLWIHHFKKLYVSLGYLAAKSLQSCPTLCNPIDGSPPGSPIPGILQARTLERVAISFSNVWKWKVKAQHHTVRLLVTFYPSTEPVVVFLQEIFLWETGSKWQTLYVTQPSFPLAVPLSARYVYLQTYTTQC